MNNIMLLTYTDVYVSIKSMTSNSRKTLNGEGKTTNFAIPKPKMIIITNNEDLRVPSATSHIM